MALIRVCCECEKSEDNGEWDHHEHHKDKVRSENATHGFCPPCYETKMAELKERYNL